MRKFSPLKNLRKFSFSLRFRAFTRGICAPTISVGSECKKHTGFSAHSFCSVLTRIIRQNGDFQKKVPFPFFTDTMKILQDFFFRRRTNTGSGKTFCKRYVNFLLQTSSERCFSRRFSAFGTETAATQNDFGKMELKSLFFRFPFAFRFFVYFPPHCPIFKKTFRFNNIFVKNPLSFTALPLFSYYVFRSVFPLENFSFFFGRASDRKFLPYTECVFALSAFYFYFPLGSVF